MSTHELIRLAIAGSGLLMLLCCTITVLLYQYFKRQHRHNTERAALLLENERHLQAARLEEQELAMSQISREIHDNVGQKMDLLLMNIKAIRSAGYPDPLRRYVAYNEQLTQQLSDELRNISYNLDGHYVQQRGIGDAIQQELAYMDSTQRIATRFDITGNYATLPPDTELLIYRIFQETLHNTLKHAHASELAVVLHYHHDRFELEIRDNGTGFDAHNPGFTPGLGMHNMEQRARLAGGTLSVGSEPGKGTWVQLELPRHQ